VAEFCEEQWANLKPLASNRTAKKARELPFVAASLAALAPGRAAKREPEMLDASSLATGSDGNLQFYAQEVRDKTRPAIDSKLEPADLS